MGNSNSASVVRKDVVEAYRPYAAFLLEKLQESWDAETAAAVADSDFFKVLDTSGDGLLDFDEFVSGMQKLHKELGGSISNDTLETHFMVFDADGSGKLSKQEAMVAFYNLAMTVSARCDNCHTNINPWEDAGYCCKTCRSDPACHDTPEHWFDLCTSCHARKAAVCSKHPGSEVVQTSTVCPRPGSAGQVVITAPGLNDDPAAPEHSAPCLCCGEAHTIVLSYLRPDLQDLHMRPLTTKNPDTGKTELLGMVCEFCAMRVCSKHNYDCMFWDLDARTPGLCTKPFDCGHRINCPGHGSNPGLDRLQQLALERHAAHCPTCMDKLDKGLKLWELAKSVSPEPPVTPAGQDTATPIPQKPLVETCFCCQEQHFVSNMGKHVDPYLSTGPHMQQLPDGSWVCELCSTWVCMRCGTIRDDPTNAVIHRWSRELVCAQKCQKVKPGGWGIVRGKLYALADESHMVHCQPCRNKLLRRTLVDMADVSAQQQARKNADTVRNVKTGITIGNILLALAGAP